LGLKSTGSWPESKHFALGNRWTQIFIICDLSQKFMIVKYPGKFHTLCSCIRLEVEQLYVENFGMKESHKVSTTLHRDTGRRDLSARRLLCWAGHGLNDSYFFLLPLVLPVILAQLHIQLREAGLIVSAFLCAAAVSSYLSGRIANRLASWKLIAAGFVLVALGTISASFVNTLPMLIVLFVVAGIGVGTFHPSTYAQFDRLAFPRTGRAFGFFELWGSATLVLMFFVNGTLLTGLGWQGVLRLTGSAGLVMALLYYWKFKNGEVLKSAAGKTLSRVNGKASTGPILLLFFVATVLRFLSSVAVLNFTPTYLVLDRGLAPNVAAYTTAFIFAGGTIFCPLVGKWVDRFGVTPMLLIVAGGIGPLVLLMSLPMPVWLLAPLLTVLGGFITGAAPIQNVFLSRLQSRLGIGTVFGMMMGLIALIASVSPLMFAYLAEHLGIAAGLRLFSLPAVAGLAVLAFMIRVERKQKLRRETSVEQTGQTV
jgi:MFS family permease